MDYTELPDVSEIPSRLLTQDEMAVVLVFRKDGSTPDADIGPGSTDFWAHLSGLITALNADPDHSYIATKGVDVDIETGSNMTSSLADLLASVGGQPEPDPEAPVAPEGPSNEPVVNPVPEDIADEAVPEPQTPTDAPTETPVDTPSSEPTEAPVDTPQAPVEGDQPIENPNTVDTTNGQVFQPPTDKQAGLSHGGIGDIAN